ncbi:MULTISPECIES: outer membrane protein assembly factor BamD [Pseudoalteromonas]|uniref:Outer membrane protein assembly factor BamD n=2 Tax=Pseudoalteromonas ruthenica TaxID=151081 RepID=A0A0F4PZL4_9GAMM|nr:MULTISPECIES: outer membrane protein assembly factor BamD [Pseudoalteromonas]KJZ00863.1 membrane protein [Pseudoalteromonas ruthenica]KJZ01084.1 membrane protein [Pseudoalteromonas ruthenica]MCF2863158.1 outer membrane protein assembly factor BamD [Pseudoalteromonas sp. CNAT2-18]MCG7542971.1 outer membrane protein assembly factor BamD [Pseudoalteromonas sp. MM17-2]MCG7559310.1 outer membrane protein assembly factor BamD [Pseudoalteromonas sp. CNAT2-18.1]|tara:strand:- start:863 stop:1621 length:759 start_codon:yes stop_codon:yes gene_type:complete
MINKISKRALAVVFTASLLSACSSAPEQQEIERVPNKSAQALYEDARETLDSGLYARAIELLTAIDSRYPFGPFSKQVQMDLVYAHYQTGNTEQALATIDRFIRLNPNHKDLDYMYYMRGLVNIKADKNAFQEYFGVDRADRDAKRTRVAYKDLSTLVNNYPDSKYAPEAKRRLAWLLNRMARNELKVAQYYYEREAYLAAANRGKYVVEHFSQSSYLEPALEMMVKSYEKLGLPDMAEHAQQTLEANKRER